MRSGCARRRRRRSRRLVSPHRLRIQFPSLAGVYRAGRVMSSILIGQTCAHANHVEEGRRSAAAKYSRIHERAASTGCGGRRRPAADASLRHLITRIYRKEWQ